MTRRRARVEMIPLIDCVFILLVFFIYSMLAMTVQRGLVVQLPDARAAEASGDEATVITVAHDGAIMLDDTPLALDGLADAIASRRGGGLRSAYVINADRRAAHGEVVRVLDELRSGGVTSVTILSREPRP